MQDTSPRSAGVKGRLDQFLSTRMPPSASTVEPIYREITICYAYMCPYAYGCTEKTVRPAQVLKRRCLRYRPETVRIQSGLSDLALDLLAGYRERGEPLAPATIECLDELRPNGPLRR